MTELLTEPNSRKPYVVSADLVKIMEPWAKKRDFKLPNADFFALLRTSLVDSLGAMFLDIDLIPEKEITEGVQSLVEATSLPPVSLDAVYYQTRPGLELTRAVNSKKQNFGTIARPGSPTILQQVQAIKDTGLNELALVDDVVFSGDLAVRVSHLLKRNGIKVPMIIAGVAVEEGICKAASQGLEVRAVRSYQEVIDEVCERDFYPGVPYSGRTLVREGNFGAPYILPFGKPEEWASIPGGFCEVFSIACLYRTERLFRAIEWESKGRAVLCQDLDRKVGGMPQNGVSFVQALQNVKVKG